MTKKLMIMGLVLWANTAFTAQLQFSDGKDFDVVVSYTVQSSISGTNGACRLADITKIVVKSKTGKTLNFAEVQIDRDAKLLHEGLAPAQQVFELKCHADKCSLSQDDTDNRYRKYDFKFGYSCSGPGGPKLLAKYAKIIVDSHALEDPGAPQWRKTAFQLKFQPVHTK